MVTPEFKVPESNFDRKDLKAFVGDLLKDDPFAGIAQLHSLRTWISGSKGRREWEVGLMGREIDELAFAIIEFNRPECGRKWLFHDEFEVLVSPEQTISIVRLQMKVHKLPNLGFLTQMPPSVVDVIAQEIRTAVGVDLRFQEKARDAYDIIYTTMNLLWKKRGLK